MGKEDGGSRAEILGAWLTANRSASSSVISGSARTITGPRPPKKLPEMLRQRELQSRATDLPERRAALLALGFVCQWHALWYKATFEIRTNPDTGISLSAAKLK